MEIKILMLDDDSEQCNQIKRLIDGETSFSEDIIIETKDFFEKAIKYANILIMTANAIE